jgi:hypothetical protein
MGRSIEVSWDMGVDCVEIAAIAAGNALDNVAATAPTSKERRPGLVDSFTLRPSV